MARNLEQWIEVLTEPKWFKGTLADLRDVRVRTAVLVAVRAPLIPWLEGP